MVFLILSLIWHFLSLLFYLYLGCSTEVQLFFDVRILLLSRTHYKEEVNCCIRLRVAESDEIIFSITGVLVHMIHFDLTRSIFIQRLPVS